MKYAVLEYASSLVSSQHIVPRFWGGTPSWPVVNVNTPIVGMVNCVRDINPTINMHYENAPKVYLLQEIQLYMFLQ